MRDIDSLLGFGETEDELEMKSDDDDDDHSSDENDSSSATDQAGRRSHLRDDRSTDSVRRARYNFIMHRVSENLYLFCLEPNVFLSVSAVLAGWYFVGKVSEGDEIEWLYSTSAHYRTFSAIPIYYGPQCFSSM